MSVAILSDHELVTRGLAVILEAAGIRVVGPDRRPVEGSAPTVVLYDADRMVSRDRAELDEFLSTGAPVVVLVSGHRPDLHAEVAQGREVSVVQFAMGASEIVDVVRGAAAGETRDVPLRVSEDPGLVLSPREAQVLGLIARGWSNNEIAAHLYLSINSIKTYIRTTYRKLGVERRSQAVVWATAHGFPADLAETPTQSAPE